MTLYDEGTSASRTVFFCGHCVQEVCEKVSAQLFDAAGRMLGIPDYRKFYIEDGVIYLKTFPEYHVTVREAAYASEHVFGIPFWLRPLFPAILLPLQWKTDMDSCLNGTHSAPKLLRRTLMWILEKSAF